MFLSLCRTDAAARTPVFCAISSEAAKDPGGYFDDCEVSDKYSSEIADNVEIQVKLKT